MSLTAGFDLVFEISDSALERLVLAQMPVGLPVTEPVELPPQLVSIGDVNGTIQMVLDQLTVRFLSEMGVAQVRIEATHAQTSISSSFLTRTICPLQGVFVVQAPIMIGSSPIPNSNLELRQAQIDLQNATVTHSFSNPENIEAVIPGASALISLAFRDQFRSSMLSNLASPLAGVGPGIAFNANGDGSLVPLVVTRIEIKYVPGGLVLFCNLDNATRRNGDVNAKAGVAIPPNRDLALHLSPGGFRRKLFCPIVAEQAKAPVSSLPTACGNAGSFSMHVAQADTDVDITRIEETFEFGRIRVDGSFRKSGFCYELTGSFQGQITFPSRLGAKFDLLATHSDYDVDWYCELAATVIGALTGGAAFGAFSLLGVKLFESGMDASFTSKLQSGLTGLSIAPAPFGANLFKQMSFTTPIVTPNGLTLPGFVGLSYFVYHPQQKKAELLGAIARSGTRSVDSGIVQLQTPCDQEPLLYPWTMFAVTETADFRLITVGYTRPLHEVHWRLYVTNAAMTGVDQFALEGNGDLEVEVHTVVPDIDGEVQVRQKVIIGYNASADSMLLVNKTPEKGLYAFTLQVSGTDCGGKPLSAWHSLGFTGLVLEVGGGWHERWADCMEGLFKRLKDKIPYHEYVPPVEKVDRPPEGRFKQFFDVFINHADHSNIAMIKLTKLAHAETVARVHLQESGRHMETLVRATQAKAIAEESARVRQLAERVESLRSQLDTSIAELQNVEGQLFQMTGISR